MTDVDVTQHAATRGPSSDAPANERWHRALGFGERYALLGVLIGLCAFFALYGPTSATFPTAENLRAITGNESVTAIAALAAVIPLVTGQFDVSVGAVLGMSSIIAADAMANHGAPVWLAVVLAVLGGAVAGAINGFFVAYLKVNSFIVTLASSTLIGGLVALYTNNETILNGIPSSVQDFGSGSTLGIPRPTWVVILLAVAVAYLLAMTTYGRAITSIGSNRRAARLVGLRVDMLTWSTFVLSGTLAGLAGVIELTRTGSGNPVIGFGFTLSALSAAFLGATAIRPGRFNVPGTLIGVLVVAVGVNGLTLAGAADWVEPVFTGAALMLAVALSTQLGVRRGAARDE